MGKHEAQAKLNQSFGQSGHLTLKKKKTSCKIDPNPPGRSHAEKSWTFKVPQRPL